MAWILDECYLIIKVPILLSRRQCPTLAPRALCCWLRSTHPPFVESSHLSVQSLYRLWFRNHDFHDLDDPKTTCISLAAYLPFIHLCIPNLSLAMTFTFSAFNLPSFHNLLYCCSCCTCSHPPNIGINQIHAYTHIYPAAV